jgi:hypothetical protein
MAVRATHAAACFPEENCWNCGVWQTAQLRGETRRRTRLSSHAVDELIIAAAASLAGK